MTGHATATGSLRVVIDRERCMGSGNCVHWSADVFDVADDMVAIVAGDPDAHRERVLLAAEHCPTNAIRVDGV
ncbi:MAG: ferredoxin [Acidimicrobiales bacterium]